MPRHYRHRPGLLSRWLDRKRDVRQTEEVRFAVRAVSEQANDLKTLVAELVGDLRNNGEKKT